MVEGMTGAMIVVAIAARIAPPPSRVSANQVMTTARHHEPGDDKGGKGNTSIARERQPGDDHGRHHEPGDDKGGNRQTSINPNREVEPGDDHGRKHREPGDDHGGR